MNPSIEEMLTIDPPPALVIGSITAFMPSQQPTAFTSSTRRKSASGMSAMLAKVRMPALFDQHVEPAEDFHRQGDRGGPVAVAGDVVVGVPAGLLAEPGRHRRALVISHVAEHHPGALGDEVPHVGLAHAPGAARDQRDLAVEPAHGPPCTKDPCTKKTLQRLCTNVPGPKFAAPNACLARA